MAIRFSLLSILNFLSFAKLKKMPEILIKNLRNKVVQFNSSDNSILNAIHNEFIDWMHTCGGKGRCTTCKMRVTSGMKNLTDLSQAEQRFRNLGKLLKEERLACQCSLKGNIEIEVCEENKLPHMEYSY